MGQALTSRAVFRFVVPAWAARHRRLVMVAAAALLLGGGGALAFGPFVRGRVDRAALQRGLVTTVGRVKAGWLAVELEDVAVAPEGTTGIQVHLDDVRVELDGLSVGRLFVRGGSVELDGDVRSELDAWRLRHPAKGEGGGRTPVTIEGVTVAWKNVLGDADASVTASGLSVTRGPKETRLATTDLVATRGRQTVTFGVTSATVVEGMLREAHVESARLSIGLDAPEAPVERPTDDGRFHPLFPLPDLHLLRAALQNSANQVAEHVPSGLHVELDRLMVELTRGTEKLDLGPGAVSIDRREEALEVAFSAGAEAQTPLTLKATVPVGGGETTVSLSGGPVTLSMLGVRDGAFGLVDPGRAGVRGRARVALDDVGKTFTFDGDVAVSSLSIRSARLASETVRGLDVRLSARGVLDDAGAVRLDDAEAQLGAVHLRAHGGFQQSSYHTTASVSFELPVAGCQSLLESVPAALFPHVGLARFKGTLGATGYLAFDTRKLDDLTLKYDVDDLCRVTSVPNELKRDHFRGHV